jgi:hypothetical protein
MLLLNSSCYFFSKTRINFFKLSFIISIVLYLNIFYISAQTGPGGVGNSSNNVLWLDAGFGVYSDTGASLAINNSNVQLWSDRSGNGKHATEATLGNRPNYITNTLNGLPTLRFTAANADRLTSTNLTTANNASVWVVASYVTLPASNAGLLQATPSGLSASTLPADKSIGMWVRSNTAQIWEEVFSLIIS